jgi:phosphonate degradation associated HDIG domain protein
MSRTSTIVDELERLFAERGARDYVGEPVSQAEHALQCAALAEAGGQPDAVVAAALLHDVGHLLESDALAALEAGDDQVHEDLARDFLAPHFPPDVTEPVRLHVAAKRYLCAVEPAYHEALSAASRRSLELQGGPMDAAEAAAFAASPHHAAAVTLRRFDDQAKVPGRAVPGFAHYRAVLERLLRESVR